MPAVDSEVLNVGGACLGDSKAVQAKQDRQRGEVVVIALGGKEEPSQFGAVQAATLRGVNLGSADILSRVRCDRPVDVSESVEPPYSREAPINGRGGQTALFERAAVQLDMRSSRVEDVKADPASPLEVVAQVVAVGVERPAAVAS
jgi:hypothetical protein